MWTSLQIISTHLFRQIAVMSVAVFLLSRFTVFRNILSKKDTSHAKNIVLAIFFGFISIMGTSTGFPVKDAIANSRAVGIIVAGLIGGPVAGVGAGFIAGLHRYPLGGITINAAFLSCILQGWLAGLYSRRSERWNNAWLNSMFLAFALEIFHFFIVLLISRPLQPVLQLVRTIAPPMIITNSIGVGLFIAILEMITYRDSILEGNAAQLALKIANYTLPYLRGGLNAVSAKRTAEIIFENVGTVDLVTILSRTEALAYKGRENAEKLIFSISSEQILRNPSVGEAFLNGEIQCIDAVNPSKGASPVFGGRSSEILFPVKDDQEVVAAVILSRFSGKKASPLELKLAEGLSLLFSNQIEIGKGQAQAELLAKTEVKLLQSQMNPHFLFNALNTIVYNCRANPEAAKELLIELGNYYRSNLNVSKELVPLETEIEHVRSYLKIETARHAGRIDVEYNIDTRCECMLPPLSLQPIVENSIKHGFYGLKDTVGTIKISAYLKGGENIIRISDNGVGIPKKRLSSLLDAREDLDRHIGLRNVNFRLLKIYGPRSGLKILSKPDKGTTVVIRLPIPA